jgi:AraC-like DNA-binding protein
MRLALQFEISSLDYGGITAVSAESGYANATAFTWMFKRALGFPPSQLRAE